MANLDNWYIPNDKFDIAGLEGCWKAFASSEVFNADYFSAAAAKTYELFIEYSRSDTIPKEMILLLTYMSAFVQKMQNSPDPAEAAAAAVTDELTRQLSDGFRSIYKLGDWSETGLFGIPYKDEYYAIDAKTFDLTPILEGRYVEHAPMRYRSENEFGIFEFHDAQFILERFENGNLTVSAEHLNIHRNTAQNPSETDMEIDYAIITFTGFRVHTLEETESWNRIEDEAGKVSRVADTCSVLEGKAAEERFIKHLEEGFDVYAFGRFDGSLYYFDTSTSEPPFTSKISFDTFTVEWDNYCGKAWYVRE